MYNLITDMNRRVDSITEMQTNLAIQVSIIDKIIELIINKH